MANGIFHKGQLFYSNIFSVVASLVLVLMLVAISVIYCGRLNSLKGINRYSISNDRISNYKIIKPKLE